MQCIRHLKNFKSDQLNDQLRLLTSFAKLINFKTYSPSRLPLATKLLNRKPSPQCKPTIARFSTNVVDNEPVDYNTFDKASEETLESLTDYFEELIERSSYVNDADVSYSGGVLTINLGTFGTYVINRQSPNKQIWLSSPTSGPKRYDFVAAGEYWVYKHDGMTLHQLLQKEIPEIVRTDVDFSQCLHSKL